MKKHKKAESKKAKVQILDNAEKTALYYGFKILPMPAISKENRKNAHYILKDENGLESPCTPELFIEENIAILKSLENESIPKDQASLYVFSDRMAGKAKHKNLFLEIVGSSKNIAEAILIHTIFEILNEEGLSEGATLKINSMGDREAGNRFYKELQNFWKKNMEELTSSCKQGIRKHILTPLCCGHEKCKKVLESAPNSMAYLSEGQRNHFMGVLEYLESLKIPYEIDNTLFGNKAWCSQTIFKIIGKDGEILAIGARHTQLPKKIDLKKELPAIGAKIILPQKTRAKLTKTKEERPLVCFVQLGLEAKHKSLNVLRILRKNKISVYQSLSKDKIGGQLSVADNLKIPYLLIMGQREAVTDSIIVRNNNNRSQEIVKIEDLGNYIKKLKIK